MRDLDVFTENWHIFYAESEELVYTHTDRDHHYVRVARAIDRDHAWYGLLHVGRLDPADHRYTGADRQPFTTFEEAQEWAHQYMETHPDGIDPDDLEESHHHYCWDNDETYPVDF